MPVMISYSHEDWPAVEPVVELLKVNGIDVWIDRERIKPDMVWRLELLKAPQTTDGLICFMSQNYIASDMCRMELLLARNFDKPVYPVMLEECWQDLEKTEETRHLSMILASRLGALRVVGLDCERDEVLKRLVRAVKRQFLTETPDIQPNVYISYPDGTAEFATGMYSALNTAPIHPWIATMNCEVGEDWRKSQTQAMSKVKVNVIVLSEGFVLDDYRSEVLRTETLMAEAFELPTLCVLSPSLDADRKLRNQVFTKLASQQAFRRLTERQWFSSTQIDAELKAEIIRRVT